MVQISRASLTPESSYIAKPAASWLDDFLVWVSPEAFGCCRKFLNASYCPPDDQVGGLLHILCENSFKILLFVLRFTVYNSLFCTHSVFPFFFYVYHGWHFNW